MAVLSGEEGGNYHALVQQLAAEARGQNGRITNIPTRGSIDNIERLSAARESCDVQFALAQDGLDWPQGLELVARLPRSESVFFLGRKADPIETLLDLRGFKIGIGPEGSGTAVLVRTILESRDLASLGLTLTNHPLDEQLSLLDTGVLDLGAFVIDEDARLIDQAVRDRGLGILSLPRADVIARRLPRVRTGRVGAGQYDPVRVLPPADKTVLRVDALVIGNGCAKRTAATGLLTLLASTFPDLIRRNQDTPNASGLPLAAASRSFFEEGGPDMASEHVPWAVDIMPLSNWIYAITAVSVLFNLMTLWSKFNLWRIDARRVKAEERLASVFRPGITAFDITRLAPTIAHRAPTHRAAVAEVIGTLEELSARCRRESLSIASDMGQEMPYRYQEHLIAELLDALRDFQGRVEHAGRDDLAGARSARPGTHSPVRPELT